MRNQLMPLLRCCKYFIFRKTHFSETGEDIVLNQFIDRSPGKFVDVGAHHPITGSNTFGLYIKGWSGIAVEPQTKFNLLWKVFRRRDLLINSPVSSKLEVVFHYFTNTLLNTINSKVANIHKSDNKWLNSVPMKAISLHSILPFELSPLENFVLSIDIEGAELEALSTIDWKVQKPRLILVESWEKPWIRGNETNAFLSKKHYKLEAYTGLTSVYVAQEFLNSRATLKEKLTQNARTNHEK